MLRKLHYIKKIKITGGLSKGYYKGIVFTAHSKRRWYNKKAFPFAEKAFTQI